MTEAQERAEAEGLALAARDPITLEFRRTPLKRAFEYVTEAFGINVIFDEDIENVPVTLFAQHVTFHQALNLMLT
nr:general secretion pathway protein GspD [Gammaproteobacteria bacterium]